MRSNLVRIALAWLCSSLVIGSGLARAEDRRQGLYFTGGDDAVPAPVLGSTVEVRVTGIIARAKVTQIFNNPSREWLEGIYIFPLPENAAVDTLRMKVGDRRIEGVIQEKQEARQTYEAAKQQGVKASLLEQQRPDIFTTSIANIGPGETVEVAIEMQQTVRWEQGRFKLHFPMVVAPRYTPERVGMPVKRSEEFPVVAVPMLAPGAAPVNPFTFHVDLAPGFPLRSVESTSHKIAVEKGTKHRYAVDLADGVAPADSDFILEWMPAVGREPRAVFYSEEVRGEHYALLMVMPPDAPEAAGTRLPREAIFIVDTSGSMQGESIEQARQALLLALDRLQPGDWFNVVQFKLGAEALFPDSVPVEPRAVEAARRYVGGFKADGGTNILAALELVLGKERERDGLVRQVTFVTDGQVGNEGDIYRFIGAHLGERRLFTVAIGSAPNISFLRKSAEIGRGTFTHIANIDEVAKRMGALFAQLEAPMLRNLEVRWEDPAAEMWPERLPDLYLGEPLIVTARRGSPSGPVEVSGRRGDEVWEDSFPAAAKVRGAGIHKLWAQRKIESLLDSLQLGAETDSEKVRRSVVKLGLRHHLVTPYTSLVAVDVMPTAPAGVVPVTRSVPVNAPRGSDTTDLSVFAESLVADCITITAESPLLDERRISTGATVSQIDLDKIPGAASPWAVLQSTPGVLTDRIVGVNESGRAAQYVSPGSGADQAVWSIDGMRITDVSTSGSSPGYYDFDFFEEIQVTTGGADTTLETPGARVALVRPRGTNEWRGSARLFWGGDEIQADQDRERDRLTDLRAGSAEWGGPLRRDRFWIWGSLHRGETDRIALGGQEEESLLQGGSLKLDAQLSSSNSASLFWNRGEASVFGLGASPSRAPETTWNRDGREEAWRIEDTQIIGSSFVLTGSLGAADRTLRDLPLVGLGGDAMIDSAGVIRGTWFGLEEDSRTRTGELRASYFFNSGSLAHEVRAGRSWREQDGRTLLTAPGSIEVAGEILDLAGAADVVEIWRGGETKAETETGSAWAEDIITAGAATFILGLRFDEQDLGIPGGVRPRALSPRLGWIYSLGPERKTLLQMSLSRFASRLGTAPAFRLAPNAPATSYFFSTGGALRLWYTVNIDPLLRGNPNAVDPGLTPEITDELLLGVEHALQPALVIGFHATWRRIGDILEERLLVRDTVGRVFAATAADWVPAGSLTGILPDGTPYGVPFFDLRPGLSRTGGTLLANGDRRQDYFGLSLTWQKRLTNRWMSHGHFTWSDWTWRVGPGFDRYDDPTRILGSGDRDGEPVAGPAAALDRPYAADRFIAGRWSFHWDGLVQLPRDFNVSLAVNGREGYPLTWHRQVARDRAGIARVQLSDRIDSSRAEDVTTVDGRLEKEIEIGDLGLTLGLDLFNLLGGGAVLWRETDLGSSRAGFADEVVAPRTFRLGLQVRWR